MSRLKYYRKSMSKKLSPQRRDYYWKKYQDAANRRNRYASLRMKGFLR